MSINLDRSRDSLLDHSVCSNPHDENAIIHQGTRAQQPTAPAESDDEDALPAPPAFTSESHAAGVSSADSAAQTASSHSEVTSPAGAQAGGTSSSRASGGPERLASITTHIHGYNEPLLWTKSKLKSNAFGASPSVEANKENTHEKEAPRLIDSTITTYQSSFVADKADRPHHTFGMSADEPPTEAPPPPPLSHPIGESRGFADGADEFMSERSRSHNAVRDIPVQIQRPTDPFGASYSSTTTGGMPGFPLPHHGTSTTAWTATRYDPVTNAPQQEEYYRREVMTRTLVTRSTEALSAPPPLSRSSPIDQLRPLPDPRDEITEEFRVKYTRNIEEEERRIRESQDKRRQEEEERRRRIDDLRRGLEQQEAERLERLRIEREKIEKQFENEILQREAAEKNRIERDRQLREEEERRRRLAWEKMEEERRRLEEAEIAKRRQLEEIEKERLRREKLRLEELERQRIEAERRRLEELEKQRLERERIEKERIEIERLEIERIERIKREQREREERDREAARLAAEKLAKERAEAERLRQEQLELERQERLAFEQARREAEERERQRQRDLLLEHERREQERRDRELLERERLLVEARERERRKKELEEAARLEALRREQERLEFERLEALRREEKRKEDERREQELLDAARKNRERRDQERLEEEMRERQRQEEERAAAERRNRERLAAEEKERQRRLEEQRERDRLAGLDHAARERNAQRELERRREAERIELERRTKELQDIEKMQQQRREQERQEEERRLAELQALERRKAQERDRERELANEREQERRLQDRRSQDHLQEIAREREKKEQWAMERLRLLRLHEESEKKRQDLTSKETLERLTRKPYYSTEKLSAIGLPEVSTKVERQVFERVDKTLWTSNDHFPESSLPALPDSHDGPPRERLFANNNASQDDDDFRRGGSNRTSKYKANIQKARRDYFADGGPTADYRGPLLQQFHDGELGARTHYDPPTSTYNYAKSPYDQQPKDDVYRSKSVLGYTPTRQSRRDLTDPEAEASHSRSKSADYLMDARLREDAAPPENELQKTADGLYPPTAAPILTEHEQRYRKSVERLHTGAPDYYAGRAAPPTNLSQTTTADQRSSGYGSRPYSRQQYETSPPYYPERQRHSSGSALHEGGRPADLGSPVGGISFPRGFFDKYAGEIEDMRRSRSSLHQVDLPPPVPSTIVDSKYSNEYAREEYSKRDVRTFVGTDKLLPGYTVSTVPTDWNWPRERTSRVIEVADTFIGRQEPRTNKYGGRVTIEEVLDAIFQQTNPSNIPADPSETSPPPPHNVDGPGIYTTNDRLMDRVIKEPSLAEELLRNEPLVVRCTNCKKTRDIAEARQYYVSCKHCYTYYCSRGCRAEDWPRHKDRCSFARINTLCKEVIMKVRKDATTQYHMSKVARDGYRREGRGSVNIRFLSAHSAQSYLDDGWDALLRVEDPNELLFYYPIQTLMDQRKEPSLIQLCRKYSPQEKFILSVSIIADIEQCPETPPPEPSDARYSTINKPLRPSFDRYGALVPTDV